MYAGLFGGGSGVVVIGSAVFIYRRCCGNWVISDRNNEIEHEVGNLQVPKPTDRVSAKKLREIWQFILHKITEKTKQQLLCAKLDIGQALSLAEHDLDLFKKMVKENYFSGEKNVAFAMQVFVDLLKMSANEIIAYLEKNDNRQLFIEHPKMAKALLKLMDPTMPGFAELRTLLERLGKAKAQ